MKNIIRFLAKSKLMIFGIFLLLIVRATCELALPGYTSDILNIGLQRDGIESSVPDSIRSESMRTLQLFMKDADVNVVEKAYETSDKDNVRTLKKDVDKDALAKSMRVPECICYQLANAKDKQFSLDKIQKAISMRMMTKEQLQQKMAKMSDKMSDLSDVYLDQIAVKYISDEYKAQGKDISGMRNHYLWKVGSAMIGVTLVMTIAAVLATLLSAVVAAKVGKRLRKSVYEKVMHFTSAEMNKYSTASLITRSTNDIQQVQMVSVMLLRLVAYAPILAIGGIIKVAQTKAGMSWIIVLAVIVLAACMGVLTAVAMPKFKMIQVLVDKLNLVSREILTGVMPVRAFSREKHEEERFEKANDKLFKTQLFTNRTMAFLMPLMMFVMNGISVLIVWVGAHRVDTGTTQIGDLTAFITYSMVIVMGFLVLAVIAILLPRAGVAADRIQEIIDTPISLSDPENPKDDALEDAKGEVAFHNVGFRYPGADENVLSGIDFTASPGKITAIIGSTGSGKSTLLNLIPRFFDVTEGSITIDGVDVRTVSQKKLRSLLGYVPQKAVLFSGTVESNLKYSNNEVTDDKMKEATKIAQAEKFILDKPNGFTSRISQGGANVSGGQRQRLSIARAVAASPKVLLFDDSFSALDFKTDVALRKALAEKTKDATIIIVAQRISTILHADQIITMDDGKIAGIGKHEELLANCTAYQEIAKSQLSESELKKGGM